MKLPLSRRRRRSRPSLISQSPPLQHRAPARSSSMPKPHPSPSPSTRLQHLSPCHGPPLPSRASAPLPPRPSGRGRKGAWAIPFNTAAPSHLATPHHSPTSALLSPPPPPTSRALLPPRNLITGFRTRARRTRRRAASAPMDTAQLYSSPSSPMLASRATCIDCRRSSVEATEAKRLPRCSLSAIALSPQAGSPHFTSLLVEDMWRCDDCPIEYDVTLIFLALNQGCRMAREESRRYDRIGGRRGRGERRDR